MIRARSGKARGKLVDRVCFDDFDRGDYLELFVNPVETRVPSEQPVEGQGAVAPPPSGGEVPFPGGSGGGGSGGGGSGG